MDISNVISLDATACAQAVAEGLVSAHGVVTACLDHIEGVEQDVGAWTFLDKEHALAQASALDALRREGKASGPLHGVTVGIKDIFDTHDMPTEDGTVLHVGRKPSTDATAVHRLRQAGAVILGKTVTTELANFTPGKTRNPHDAARTPGGSSSGSAAAVAASMTQLSLGSQTNGSTIRPAAFCGVFGYKPTFGLISRHGMLRLAPALDHVGLFSRSIRDLALLLEVLAGYDEHDASTQLQARTPYCAIAKAAPPLTPLIAFSNTPFWHRAEMVAQSAFDELHQCLSDVSVVFDLPPQMERVLEWHRIVAEAEMAASLDMEWERGRERLSKALHEQLARGRAVSAMDYQRALALQSQIYCGFDDVFDRCDAIATLSAPGVAPLGLDATGDPTFCTPWTYLGMPAVNLPLMQDDTGLPIGLQLIGARGNDARLLRTARWMVERVQRELLGDQP